MNYQLTVGSRSLLSISPILEDKEPMLILAPPFNDLIPLSLYILNERARRGGITHVKWLTPTLIQNLKDVVERYPTIFLVDPPVKLNLDRITDAFNGKRIYIIHTSEINWIDADLDLEFDDSIPRTIWRIMDNWDVEAKSLKFIVIAMAHEASVSQHTYRIIEKPPTDDMEVLEYPAIPGLLIMPMLRALTHSISPIIPGITGNEENTRNILKGIIKNENISFDDLSSDDVIEIIKAIANELLSHDIKSSYLDKLTMGFIKWKDTNVDVLEILLSIESQLSLWRYVTGIVNPILNPSVITKNSDVISTINDYLRILGRTITELLINGRSKVDIEQPLSMVDRICSVAAFANKQFILEVTNVHLAIECPKTDNEDIVFNRYGYSIGIKVIGEDEGQG